MVVRVSRARIGLRRVPMRSFRVRRTCRACVRVAVSMRVAHAMRSVYSRVRGMGRGRVRGVVALRQGAVCCYEQLGRCVGLGAAARAEPWIVRVDFA